MSLSIERHDNQTGEWKRVCDLSPNDSPASISNNLGSGKREVIFIQCAKDDSESVIKVIKKVDLSASPTYNSMFEKMRSLKTEEVKQSPVIATLKPGESHEMTVMPDNSNTSKTYRFTQK